MTNQATSIQFDLSKAQVKAAIDMESPDNEYYNELIVMVQEVREFIEVDMWLPTLTDKHPMSIAVMDVYGVTWYATKVNGELTTGSIESQDFQELINYCGVLYK